MARHLLTAKQLLAAPANCDLADGDGLIVRIKNGNASAVLRFTSPISSKRREMGLGALTRDSLATAGRSLTDMRDAAERARRLLREKKDPIDEERARRDANVAVREKERAAKTAAAATLRRYARAYHEEHVEPIRSGKHVQQWINSIERHVPAWLLDANIATITATELLDALVPIQRDLPETGSRIYQRLATVFDAAVIDGLRADNPATPIKGELRKRAPRPKREGYAAMPYRKLPTFSVALRKVQGNAARCLEFAILTAARTSEALLAEWSEFDLQARTWTIPAGKMKGREQHVVYLSERAVAIVKGQEGQDERYVFPSPLHRGKPMSNGALLITLRRLGAHEETTTHGFRASFSTWANELGIARPDVIETALAHCEENAVRRAYNRAQFLSDRRALAIAWGDYLDGKPVKRADGSEVTHAEVIEFPAAQQVA